MQTLKIIKISEGVFKHVLNDENNTENIFFNTKDTKLSIDLGTIVIGVGSKTRVFRVEDIEVYDIDVVTPTPTATLDDLVTVLAGLKYPPLLESQSTGGDGVAGGSTEAKQDIANQSLEVIKNKLPTLKDGRTPVLPANITTKFREAFEKLDLVNKWSLNQGAGDLVFLDGNTAGASYLVISKSLWNAGNETALEIKDTFNMPIELSYGLHISQRAVGQELSIEIIDTDTPLPDVADLQIANLSQTTTVLTVDTIAPHGLTIGKCVGIRNCANLFANYQNLVVASIPSPTQFTCTVPTATIPNLSNSGFVYFRERFGRANNGVSQIFENAAMIFQGRLCRHSNSMQGEIKDQDRLPNLC